MNSILAVDNDARPLVTTRSKLEADENVASGASILAVGAIA
jgi:hypothetical protein